MQLNIETKGTTAFIRATGRIDTLTAPQLDDVASALVAQGIFRIVFDLSQVDYLASSAFRVFVKTQKSCKIEDGQAIIQGANSDILPLFKVSGFDRLFAFTASDVESELI